VPVREEKEQVRKAEESIKKNFGEGIKISFKELKKSDLEKVSFLQPKKQGQRNHKRKLKGHLWQGRFYSTILDESHLYSAVRYVENNPVRIGIVRKLHRYK